MKKRVASMTGEIYHIYNRGSDKREIFLCFKDYERFMVGLKEFNRIDPIGSLYEKHLREKKAENGGPTSIVEVGHRRPLVEIICYCLNHNHFHLLLKQVVDNGVPKFIQKISTAYTMYFNKKYERSGVLFQGKYKCVHVETNERLLYLSAYVNKNHEIHRYKEKDWKYSSLGEYSNEIQSGICNQDVVLGQFSNNFDDYIKFADECAGSIREMKDFSQLLLE